MKVKKELSLSSLLSGNEISFHVEGVKITLSIPDDRTVVVTVED